MCERKRGRNASGDGESMKFFINLSSSHIFAISFTSDTHSLCSQGRNSGVYERAHSTRC